MDSPALFDQLIILLRTTSDVASVLLVLQEFIDSFYSSKTHEEQQQIFKKLSPQISILLTEAFAKEPITPENQITIKRQIDDLSDTLQKCKKMIMTLAFQPDEETTTFFSEWIKKNVSKDLLLDFQFDKSIVGGAVIIVGGVYKDYSVKKQLSNKFQIQKEEIMGLLD